MIKDFFTSQNNLPVRKPTAVSLLASVLSVGVIYPALASRDSVENGGWESVGETRVVGAELVDLWLPAQFDALAEDLSRSTDCRSFDKFQKFLAERNLQRIWYAAIVRWRLADGRHNDITYIRKPFDDPGQSLEFRDLLISGKFEPGHGILARLSPRAVHVIADDQASRAPIEVVLDTLDAEDHRD